MTDVAAPSRGAATAARTVIPTVAVVAVSWLFLVRLIGPMRLYQDEWMFVARRHELGLDAVLAPHAGHPVMLSALSYMIGFRVFGLHDLRYYKFVLLLAHTSTCAVIARRIWRRHGPMAALAGWTTLCFFGAGAENIFWPFQVALVASVLFFVLACDALERLKKSRRSRDAAVVSALLCLSLMSSMVGAAAVVAVGLVVLVDRDRRRNWWIPVVPIALYVAWWFAYDPPSGESAAPLDMLRFLWAGVRTTGGALTFGVEALGVLLVAGTVALAGVTWRREPDNPQVLAGLLFTGAFWASITLGRSQVYVYVGDLSPMRFKYVAAAGLLVALGDLVPRARSQRARATGAVVALTLAAGSVWAGYDNLISSRNSFARRGVAVAAEVAVIDAHPESFSDDMPIWIVFTPLATVGEYRQAATSTGTTAGLTAQQLASLPDGLQSGAENLMLPLLSLERSRFSDCVGVDVTGETIGLAPGVTVTLAVDREATVIASRWLPPNEGGPGRHVLERGTWVIRAPDDSLMPDWSLLLGADARIISCDG